ncbi:MAG: fibronectin type III domain-containing protein [Candidatus Omnitrophica bacterium]|nr:fibronectin type III domain-containing protein [Candidatus Omnitrophota bacterium]
MRTFYLVILLLTCGCTTIEHNAFVSPSESLYYKANRSYEEKDFATAIRLYNEFLEAKPRSELVVSTNLNLGMSHYYSGDYKQSYLILKKLDITDENIKKYVDGILKICQTEAGSEIEAEKKAELAAATDKTKASQVKIRITDASIDNFGSVVLVGKTNRIASVTVNGEKVALDGNNEFSASVAWKKGRSITIAAKDESGGLSELDYFPDGESPEEPEGLGVINTSSNSIEIEWDENNENDIKGYRLFYRLKSGSTKEVPEIIEDTQYEVVGLRGYVEGANRTFEFYLRAVDKMNNESDDSDILEVVLP